MYFQRRMLPQIDGLSFSPVKVFSILIFHLLIHLNKADSQVVGPHQPVAALVDDDVILPCHVEPAEDVTAQILEWTRSDLNPRFVHVWRSGQDLVNTRNPSYRGRTSLFINELKHGNISLKLSRVKLSDEGTYKCSFPLMKKKSFVKLVVASDAATSPVISLSGIDKNRGGVVLQCESAGWYPEPELLWLDGEGNLLSAGPTETLRGPDDLYTVSSRVTVEERHSNSITCRVQQRNTNQSRETHIHVPEDFFDITSSSPSVTDTSPVSLALCILLLILSVVFLLRRKKKHLMRTKRRPKDQTEDVQVSTEEDREKEQFNMKLPITSRQQLQEEQQRREDAENTLGDLQNDKEKLENELQDEKKRNEDQEAKLKELEKKNTEIINQLQQEKETLEELKKQLETKNQELSDSISELNREKRIKESEINTMRNQLESNKQEMMKSEREKDEIITELRQTILTLESKLQEEKQKKEETEKKVQTLPIKSEKISHINSPSKQKKKRLKEPQKEVKGQPKNECCAF
ncbi:butyrophilin subfamily 2 member A2-like isoform X2 [Oreochromis aureus]|uniref:butyrophilin subfamily 2 member A2-like isoform X2 n=1 Tax=Oreochromis aureus TaxID=47969 RepID=UPI001953C0FD|nr:butyrophilin subfamily 2 member A2-like isoform X2 [Oreochromis aureus]